MDMLPILSSLKRHKTAAGLIVLQIALTCAIVCNALFLIGERLQLIGQPTGLAERELLAISVTSLTRGENPEQQTRQDLQALRALPGVTGVTLINQITFGTSSTASGIRTKPDSQQRAINAGDYSASEGWLQTLGLRLAEGRDFEPGEYADSAQVFKEITPNAPPVIILSRSLAQRLFPGQSALGQQVYVHDDQPQTVVGVLELMPSTHPSAQAEHNRYTFIQPIRPSYRGGAYMLRVADPAQRDAVLKSAAATLSSNSIGIKRMVRLQRPFEEMRNDYYRQDRFMVGLLVVVCAALLLVTAFGIVGLASFWVQQRSRMIGTRRALGATRGQIRRYFQAENFLLTSLGIVLGMAGAYGINLVLMTQYELPRLPLAYLPLGALLLWSLGQLAVLAPARRAAALPPMMVMRGLA